MKRGSLRSKIPTEIREQLAEDPYMARCILEDETCSGRIEWMHCFTYGGKRVNELWSILPGCHKHHYEEAKHRFLIRAALVKRIQQLDMLDNYRKKYPKATLPTI